jgi:hypothetical protein
VGNKRQSKELKIPRPSEGRRQTGRRRRRDAVDRRARGARSAAQGALFGADRGAARLKAAVRPPQFLGSAPNNGYGGAVSGVSAGMSFAYGFVIGLVAAWAPCLILLSYLAWKASREPSVRTGSETTSQGPLAKVLGPLRPKPRTQ